MQVEDNWRQTSFLPVNKASRNGSRLAQPPTSSGRWLLVGRAVPGGGALVVGAEEIEDAVERNSTVPRCGSWQPSTIAPSLESRLADADRPGNLFGGKRLFHQTDLVAKGSAFRDFRGMIRLHEMSGFLFLPESVASFQRHLPSRP